MCLWTLRAPPPPPPSFISDTRLKQTGKEVHLHTDVKRLVTDEKPFKSLWTENYNSITHTNTILVLFFIIKDQFQMTILFF